MDHLDENTAAAYAYGSHGAGQMADVEKHLLECSFCRRLVSELVKDADGDEGATVGVTRISPSRGGTLPALPRGAEVGRYLVLDRIGAGGMGVVYAAYDPVLERKVALKLVRTAGSPALNEEVRGRLLREGKSVAQLAHPNVVAVYDMGTSHDEVFIAMELVEGGSLKEWLKAAPRAWRDVLRVFVDAGEGLAAAHRQGLVHRDFKPENVLLGKDGRARVTDFGLVRSMADAPTPVPATQELSAAAALDPLRTQTGALLGTPAYMSPEQYQGRDAQALSDQFSFCVSLWESLYGARPYDTTAEVSQWRLLETPRDKDVPAWVKRALQKGLSLDPALRYRSIDELLAALRADPKSVTRRRLVLVAALGGVAIFAVGSYVTRNRALCTGGAEQVAALWSPATQETYRAAFVGTGRANAAEVWSLAQHALDQRFAAWASTHTQACEATRIKGTQSDQLLSLRMACLERRRNEMAALLHVFARPDAEVVARAPEAVAALVGIDSCSDTQALLAEVRPPEDESARAMLRKVRSSLADAKARFDSGKYGEAQTTASAALEAARTLGYRPAIAEALLLLGQLQEHLGQLAPAEQSLLDSISTAEASRHDEVAARAATHLMLVLGARQARFAEAHAWGKLAHGAIERIGGREALEAQLDQTEGLVLYAEGKLADAIERHRRAVSLRERLAPDSLELAESLNGLGAALRGGGQPAEALDAYRRSLAIVSAKVSPDSDLIATARNGIANVMMLDARFDEALALYQQSLDTFEKVLGPTHFKTVTTLNNISVALAEQGKFAEALPFFERVLAAREASLKPTDAKLADAHSNVGMLLVELQRYDEALAHFARAHEILQGYPIDHFSQAEPLLGTAKVWLQTKVPLKAVVPLERVLLLCQKREGFRFEYTKARASFLLGRALYEGRQDKPKGKSLANEAKSALTGFGSARFRRDLAEIDDWLAGHP